MSRSSIPRAFRDAVWARDGGRCQYCGLAQHGHGATFHIDHVIPRSKGGPTGLDNLALQCPSCSLHNGDRTGAQDPTTGQQVDFFHPVRQSWDEHFALNVDGTLRGLTPTGRATVVALGMNARIPQFARACQIALGLLSPR